MKPIASIYIVSYFIFYLDQVDVSGATQHTFSKIGVTV